MMLGRALLAAQRPAEAIEHLSVLVEDPAANADQARRLAATEFRLARAVAGSDGSIDEARTHAESARARWAALAEDARVEEIDAWLADHPGARAASR
jgi:hypothetical protein